MVNCIATYTMDSKPLSYECENLMNLESFENIQSSSAIEFKLCYISILVGLPLWRAPAWPKRWLHHFEKVSLSSEVFEGPLANPCKSGKWMWKQLYFMLPIAVLPTISFKLLATTLLLQRFNGLFSMTTRVSRHQKGKPILDLLE